MGSLITLSRFLCDIKAAEEDVGENDDIIQECKGVRRFSWGNASKATYCLSLACCFYLQVKWVMCRFFEMELKGVQKADLQLMYDNDQLDAVYQLSEDLFAQEFNEFIGKVGTVRIDEN
jgi:hypothetical protein